MRLPPAAPTSTPDLCRRAPAPAQLALGLGVYLWPGGTQEQRQALGPVHRFQGQSTYVAGLAAVAVSDHSPQPGRCLWARKQQHPRVHRWQPAGAILNENGAPDESTAHPTPASPARARAWPAPPQSGLQEKSSFLQLLGKQPVFSAFIRAPAWTAALLLPLGMLVLWPQAEAGADAAAAAAAGRPPPGQHELLAGTDDEEEGGRGGRGGG